MTVHNAKKRKAGGLDAMRNVVAEIELNPEISVEDEVNNETVVTPNRNIANSTKLKPKNFPYLIHPAVHDLIRDIAHVERRSMTSIINEGLDLFLKSRAQPTIEEMKRNK